MKDTVQVLSPRLVVVVVMVMLSNLCGAWNPKDPISRATIEATEHGDGLDVSFPQHHYLDEHTWQGKRYKKFIDGCYKAFGKKNCDATEMARINQNYGQPKFEHNYTTIGFKKMRVPAHVWDIVTKFWDTNWKDGAGETLEKWPPGNTYTNNWDSPTYMVRSTFGEK